MTGLGLLAVLITLSWLVTAVPTDPQLHQLDHSDRFGPHISLTTRYPLPNAGNLQVHDPNIIEDNGYLYLFRGGVHVPIHRARNISGPWESLGTVLDSHSTIHKKDSDRPWAPTTIAWKGKYYCFYAVSRIGSRDSSIGVATSDSLDHGTWHDHGAIVNTGQGGYSRSWPYRVSNAIDPAFITDQRTGKPYLTYGSYWHNIFLLPLADDLLAVENAEYPDAVNTVYQPGTRVKPVEGSFMSYREPYYYLWFSHGRCCEFRRRAFPSPGHEYSIRVGRSKNIRGPFVDRDGRQLTQGGGTIVYASNHGTVYAPGGLGVLPEKKEDGRPDILYFHYMDSHIGYADSQTQLGWTYLEYVDGWPEARPSKEF